MQSFIGIVVSIVVIYILFQRHALPNGIARIVAKVFFYPTMPFTYLSRRQNYWTLIDSHVFLGGAPIVCLGHVDALYDRGVRAVINTCDEYCGPIQAYKRKGIHHLHVPTIDHTEPTVEAIQKSMEFIEFHKSRGSRVYIHCKAGKGRSAAIALCWLLYANQMTLKEAQQYLNEKRDVRKTLFQQPHIQQFYQQHSKHFK